MKSLDSLFGKKKNTPEQEPQKISKKSTLLGLGLAHMINTFAGTGAPIKAPQPLDEKPSAITYIKPKEPSAPILTLEQQKKLIDVARQEFQNAGKEYVQKQRDYIGRIIMFNELLDRGAAILNKEGRTRDAAALLHAKKLIPIIEAYANNFQASAGAHTTENDIVKGVTDKILNYNNKETGAIIQALEAVLNNQSIGGTTVFGINNYGELADILGKKYQEAMNGHDSAQEVSSEVFEEDPNLPESHKKHSGSKHKHNHSLDKQQFQLNESDSLMVEQADSILRETDFNETKSMIPIEDILDFIQKSAKLRMSAGPTSEDVFAHQFLGNYSQYAKAYLDWKAAAKKLNLKKEYYDNLIKNTAYPLELNANTE